MYVKADVGGALAAVTLEEPENFTEFKLVAVGRTVSLTDALHGLGRIETHEHAYLAPDAVAALAGPLAQDPSWRERFDAMVAWAAEKGWADERGAIRAHIERRDGAQPASRR